MGVSNELQYGLPMAMFAVLMNFIAINYNIRNIKIYSFFSMIVYTVLKVGVLKWFHYDKHIVDLAIFTLGLVTIFFIIQFYFIKHEKKEKEQIINEIKVGYIYGIVLIILPIALIGIFRINIYHGEIKNLIMIFIEFFIVGLTYIIMAKKGLAFEKGR